MLKVGTLFSGIGSPEEALKKLGVDFEVIFASDIDKNAKKTYLSNHKCQNFYEDIKDIPNNVKKIDLLVFGFPCQPFSLASSNCRGLEDNRGKLFFEACRILKNTKPKYFVAENVKNLLKIDEGKTFNIIIKELEKCGYKVKYKILNSLDYGVPQNRERIYIVGIRKDIKKCFSFNKLKKQKHISLKKILKKVVDKKYYATNKFLSKDKVKKRLQNYKKDYIQCLTKTISRNGSSSEYISYVAAVNNAIGEYRKPTPRECARLHGFSDDFILPLDVCMTQQYNQFANTMTVNVMENILRILIR